MSATETGGRNLKVVYKAPDEFMANTIKSLLENEGIDAVIKSHQIAMYDSIAMMMKPEWGQVLVRHENYEEAKCLVEGFLSVAEEDAQPKEE
jgi:hypothetical protein